MRQLTLHNLISLAKVARIRNTSSHNSRHRLTSQFTHIQFFFRIDIRSRRTGHAEAAVDGHGDLINFYIYSYSTSIVNLMCSAVKRGGPRLIILSLRHFLFSEYPRGTVISDSGSRGIRMITALCWPCTWHYPQRPRGMIISRTAANPTRSCNGVPSGGAAISYFQLIPHCAIVAKHNRRHGQVPK